MISPRTLRRLGGDLRGAVAVEFALLAPAFIVMLFGVLQVGIGLQNYNAMRSLSADVARYAMIEHAKGTVMSNTALTTYAENLGSGPPYLLIPENLDVTIAPAATPQEARAGGHGCGGRCDGEVGECKTCRLGKDRCRACHRDCARRRCRRAQCC